MTPSATRTTAATEAVVQLSGAGLPPLELLRQVARRVRSVVPYAAAGWLLTDPATMLHTGAVTEDVPADLQLALIDNELVGGDAAPFSELARSRSPVRRLSDATEGRLERSTRYRRLYGPAGFADELRVVFRVDGACWAVGCLARRDGEPPFSAPDLSFLAGLSAPVAAGVRTGLRTAAPDAGSGEAGLLVLGADGTAEAMTDAAERWLDDLPRDGLELPGVVYEVASAARAAPPARARVRACSGRWLLVHAAALHGTASSTAVVIEPARGVDLAPLVVELYGLTDREREITALLARGDAIVDIARSLSISRHTVRDHVKSAFAKLEVSSRPELTAKLFYEHVVPELVTASPVD